MWVGICAVKDRTLCSILGLLILLFVIPKRGGGGVNGGDRHLFEFLEFRGNIYENLIKSLELILQNLTFKVSSFGSFTQVLTFCWYL